MRSLKSGLIAIALTGIFGTAAVVGCSADGGGSGIDTESDPTVPEPGSSGSVVPPRTDDGAQAQDAGKTDSGKKDSGTKAEAGFDAGPPPPVEGASCPTLNAIGKKTCGACGTAETVCLDDGTGKGKWSPYGSCNNELTNGCIPGTVVDEPCGNCGTQKKTCNQYCAFTTSTCNGQPANSCVPGTTEYTTAGCPAGDYRNRTCGAACTWSGFSAACAAPVNDIVLNIPATVGATSSKTITFSAAKQGPRISGFSACPQAGALSSGNYPYQYVELHNPNAKAAKVTVYASAAPGGAVIDTIMAGYSTAIQPMDDAAKKACAYGANDQSATADQALTGAADFSILKAVPIPAGGSILIFVATYYQNPTTDEVTTGDLNINAKIESLN